MDRYFHCLSGRWISIASNPEAAVFSARLDAGNVTHSLTGTRWRWNAHDYPMRCAGWRFAAAMVVPPVPGALINAWLKRRTKRTKTPAVPSCHGMMVINTILD